jgi:hypothetical protein
VDDGDSTGTCLAGILGLSRLVASLLFGVRPADVMTLAIVIPSIVGTAALACRLPAWRASRLDPIVLRAARSRPGPIWTRPTFVAAAS